MVRSELEKRVVALASDYRYNILKNLKKYPGINYMELGRKVKFFDSSGPYLKGESSHLAFHLNKIVDGGYVKKNNGYELTPRGESALKFLSKLMNGKTALKKPKLKNSREPPIYNKLMESMDLDIPYKVEDVLRMLNLRYEKEVEIPALTKAIKFYKKRGYMVQLNDLGKKFMFVDKPSFELAREMWIEMFMRKKLGPP